jgi:hypothetical protein
MKPEDKFIDKFLDNLILIGISLMLFGILCDVKQGWKTVVIYFVISFVMSVAITCNTTVMKNFK